LIRKSLKELLDQLDPSLFWHSTIVNVDTIGAVSRDLGRSPDRRAVEPEGRYP